MEPNKNSLESRLDELIRKLEEDLPAKNIYGPTSNNGKRVNREIAGSREKSYFTEVDNNVLEIIKLLEKAKEKEINNYDYESLKRLQNALLHQIENINPLVQEEQVKEIEKQVEDYFNPLETSQKPQKRKFKKIKENLFSLYLLITKKTQEQTKAKLKSIESLYEIRKLYKKWEKEEFPNKKEQLVEKIGTLADQILYKTLPEKELKEMSLTLLDIAIKNLNEGIVNTELNSAILKPTKEYFEKSNSDEGKEEIEEKVKELIEGLVRGVYIVYEDEESATIIQTSTISELIKEIKQLNEFIRNDEDKGRIEYSLEVINTSLLPEKMREVDSEARKAYEILFSKQEPIN